MEALSLVQLERTTVCKLEVHRRTEEIRNNKEREENAIESHVSAGINIQYTA